MQQSCLTDHSTKLLLREKLNFCICLSEQELGVFVKADAGYKELQKQLKQENTANNYVPYYVLLYKITPIYNTVDDNLAQPTLAQPTF